MRNVFRGHQPAPVPNKPIELPDVTPQMLRELAKEGTPAIRRAAEELWRKIQPRLLAAAEAGETELRLHTAYKDFPAELITPLARCARERGFKVITTVGGAFCVSWAGES